MTAAFEARYRACADPWHTLSAPYELAKMQAALDACGPGPFAAACELGAGVGGLTERLAPRCASLLALDASPTAVAAARERLAPFPCANARVATLPRDLPTGGFDLVIASEVLYYLDAESLAAVCAWLATALVPDGRVVAVHWTGRAPDMALDAGVVARALHAREELVAVAGAVHDGYRIDVLRRRR